MAVEVHPVRYGPGAVARLAALVAEAQAGDPLRPVTVVVPSNAAGVATRRALARAQPRGIAAAGFLTTYRLAELLGAPALAAAGRRPVSPPVVAAAVREALRAEPGSFAAVAGHPATEAALVAAHRELREVEAGGLERLAGASRRAGDVVRLHRAVTAALAAQWYDEVDLVASAIEAVGKGAPLGQELGPVLVHLPQVLSPGAAQLLIAVGGVQVVAGLTGVPEADGPVRTVLARLGAGPDGLAAPGGDASAGTPELEVITASDADEEVRAAVREVVAATSRGVPLERIALCWATAEPYARLVGEHLRAAGIEHNGPAATALRERAAPRGLLGLLELNGSPWSRHDVFALLTGAPIEVPGGELPPVTAWERASREAGVVAGLAQWDGRLAALANRRRFEAERAEVSDERGAASRAARARADADAADGLRQFVLELAARVEAPGTTSTWTEATAWASGLLAGYLGARTGWPSEEHAAADRVDAVLDRLAGLEAVEPAVELEVVRRTLALELDAELTRTGTLGQGVHAGPVGGLVGQDLEVVVVLGLAEGSFPARPGDDPLLPDRERSLAPELATSRDWVQRQHHQLLAACAAARHQVVLCLPRGDLRRSSHRLPSRWLVSLLAGRRGQRLRAADVLADGAGEIRHVPSYAAGVAADELPATAQQHRLRRLARHAAIGGDLPGHPLSITDRVLARGYGLVRARRSAAFTAYDGNLAGIELPSPFDPGVVVAPTRLQDYAACPHAYLYEHVLGVAPVENPEALLELSPLEKGNLLHEVLDRFVAGEIEAGRVPKPEDPWPPDAEDRLLGLFDAIGADFERRGLTGRAIFWRRDRARLRRDLREFLHRDDERRAARGATPVATELVFGRRGVPPVEITLQDGRSVRFRGSIDRVDTTADGLAVVDYKSGSASSYKDVSAETPDADGQRLQLPAYALAAAAAFPTDGAVFSEYWFTSGKGEFAAKGYAVTEEVLARYREVLAVIADSMAAGAFPARPDAPVWRPFVPCQFCDPDALGTTERWREWRRKRRAPELAALVALVEPGEDDDERA